MKTQIGTSIESDFGESTWTFEMPKGYKISVGKYAIVPIDEWKEFTLLNDEPTIATDSTEFVNYKPSGENIEKEIKQLFVGKVAGVLGGQKTYDLLKEATETIKELPRFKQTDK